MPSDRDQRLLDRACALGLDPDAPLLVGGNYQPLLLHAGIAHVSGQVPRIGQQVVVTGPAEAVGLEEARRAACIGALRALALLRQQLGSLDGVAQLLRVGVYVQAGPGFSQHSEVADAASELLVAVLGPAGRHARTSVGVASLPKNATVELELQAALVAPLD